MIPICSRQYNLYCNIRSLDSIPGIPTIPNISIFKIETRRFSLTYIAEISNYCTDWKGPLLSRQVLYHFSIFMRKYLWKRLNPWQSPFKPHKLLHLIIINTQCFIILIIIKFNALILVSMLSRTNSRIIQT